jgi:hypothetical protein
MTMVVEAGMEKKVRVISDDAAKLGAALTSAEKVVANFNRVNSKTFKASASSGTRSSVETQAQVLHCYVQKGS